MAGIFGLLGVADNDRLFVNTIGQKAVFDAANTYLQMASDEAMQAYSIFIEEVTDSYKERYKLPGGGRLQRRGGQAGSAATKASGAWDVAYPLEDFGAQMSADDVTLAYMTLQELQRHLDNIQIQNINTIRFEILKALFNNTARAFVDPNYGSLTIQPLANNDSVLYPPVMGSETEAVEDHCLESAYLASAISNTNNPYVTIRNEIEEHFGTPQGFGNICVFINSAQVALTEALSDYDQVVDNMLLPNQNRDVPNGMPMVPGRVIGRTNGVWVVEWRWIPSGYMLGVNIDAPKPLKMRVDAADTGLGQGLQLVASNDKHVLQNTTYRNRFGIGVANRLNGVAFELNTGGTYTIPTAYA